MEPLEVIGFDHGPTIAAVSPFDGTIIGLVSSG
jgi:hypothetical protein